MAAELVVEMNNGRVVLPAQIQHREIVMLRSAFALMTCFVVANDATVAKAVEPIDVLDKAITAHGGQEKLATSTSQKMTGKGTIVGPNGEQYGFSATYYFDTPNRFRADYQMAIGDTSLPVVQILDGDQGWMKVGDQTAELTKDQMESFRASLQAHAALRLVPLLDKKKFSLSLVGEIEEDGETLIGITATNKDALDASIYFDAKTYLIAKQEYVSKNFYTGKQALTEMRASHYKKTQGVMLPMQVEYRLDGKKFMAAEFESVELVKQFDASLFAKPE